jgi:hypothetical protein
MKLAQETTQNSHKKPHKTDICKVLIFCYNKRCVTSGNGLLNERELPQKRQCEEEKKGCRDVSIFPAQLPLKLSGSPSGLLLTLQHL